MVTPPILRGIYTTVEMALRGAGVIAGKSGRHMKFPYTLSAKMAQFPLFHYLKHNFIWTYYPLGFLGGLWAFGKIHAVVNSEASVRSWAESQRKIAEKEHGEHH